jgi:phospholipase/carboxylesterase
MATDRGLTRRSFVQTIGGTAAALFGSSFGGMPLVSADPAQAVLRSRPHKRTEDAKTGMQPLGIGFGRDGFMYVPATYRRDKPTPLLVLLHGATQDSTLWSRGPLEKLFDNPAVIVLAPDSRERTWDLSLGGYGPDVRFIDEALALAFRKCNIDPARIALGGFSDGASYALSLGISNGDLFSALIAFSPGYISPARRKGTPRIFVAHGTQDQILPIDQTSRTIVPDLKEAGFNVHYEEFDGPHTVTVSEVAAAMRWFVAA